jgi:lipid-binding SYLF domain-containing protein
MDAFRMIAPRLGACPTLAFLLRRTICSHLRRSRPKKILNVFQRIRLRFFRACGFASGHTSFVSSRKAMSDRLLAARAAMLRLSPRIINDNGSHPILSAFFAVTMVTLCPVLGEAMDISDAQAIVDDARLTVARMLGHPDMSWLRRNVQEAKAIFIAPEVVRIGYFAGVAKGKGVLLVKDKQTGQWSDPAFFSLMGASVGLQIGIARTEAVALIMGSDETDSFLRGRFVFGPGAALAIGPVGASAGASTTPTLRHGIVSFAKAGGAYAGVTLQGVIAMSDESANEAYYGSEMRSEDILVHPQTIGHWYSARIRNTLDRAGEYP